MSDTTNSQDDWGIGDDELQEPQAASAPEPAASDEPAPSKPKRSKPRRSRGGRRGAFTPAQARKALDTIRGLDTADERTVDVALAMTGTDGDRDDLALAILTGKVSTTKSLDDLQEIGDADEIEAAVTAGMMGRDRMSDVWRLLDCAGVDVPGEMPDADTKLAIRLASLITGLDDSDRDVLSAASELLGA